MANEKVVTLDNLRRYKKQSDKKLNDTVNNAKEEIIQYVQQEGGKIDKVKKNGVPLPINPIDKSVDVEVPTKTSDIQNDGNGTGAEGDKFITEAQVDTKLNPINEDIDDIEKVIPQGAGEDNKLVDTTAMNTAIGLALNAYAMLTTLAPTYSNASTYSVGNIVNYDKVLYKCITAVSTAEEFDSNKWTQVTVIDLITEVKNALGNYVTTNTSQTITGNKQVNGVTQFNGSVSFNSNFATQFNDIALYRGHSIQAPDGGSGFRAFISHNSSDNNITIGSPKGNTGLAPGILRIKSKTQPTEDGTLDFGALSYRWRDLYLSRNLTDGTNVISIVKIANKDQVIANATIANEYDSTATYNERDLVVYNGRLYKCNTTISVAEAWNAEHWDYISIKQLFDTRAFIVCFSDDEVYSYCTDAYIGCTIRFDGTSTSGLFEKGHFYVVISTGAVANSNTWDDVNTIFESDRSELQNTETATTTIPEEVLGQGRIDIKQDSDRTGGNSLTLPHAINNAGTTSVNNPRFITTSDSQVVYSSSGSGLGSASSFKRIKIGPGTAGTDDWCCANTNNEVKLRVSTNEVPNVDLSYTYNPGSKVGVMYAMGLNMNSYTKPQSRSSIDELTNNIRGSHKLKIDQNVFSAQMHINVKLAECVHQADLQSGSVTTNEVIASLWIKYKHLNGSTITTKVYEKSLSADDTTVRSQTNTWIDGDDITVELNLPIDAVLAEDGYKNIEVIEVLEAYKPQRGTHVLIGTDSNLLYVYAWAAFTDMQLLTTIPTVIAEEIYTPKDRAVGDIVMTIDPSTFVLKLQAKDLNGNNIGIEHTIDLPLESVVVNATYDNVNKKIVLELQNGNTVDVPIGDIINGLIQDTDIAFAYDSASTYVVGSVVSYNGDIYKCSTAVTQAEAFDPLKWTKKTVYQLIQENVPDLSNYVDLASAQTITGRKTFTNGLKIYTASNNYSTIEILSSSARTQFDHPNGMFLFKQTVIGGYSSDLGQSINPWRNLYLHGYLSDGTNSISIANIANKNEVVAAATITALYDNTATYDVGDHVMYNGRLYKCTTAVSTAEDFDSTKWTYESILEILANKMDLPSTPGTNGQVLTSDGQGGYSWQSGGGGAAGVSSINNQTGAFTFGNGLQVDENNNVTAYTSVEFIDLLGQGNVLS